MTYRRGFWEKSLQEERNIRDQTVVTLEMEAKVGGAIGACGRGIGNSLLVVLYACMTFIYGSSWKCEMASEAKRYLDRSSEESGEVFPGEVWE
ncbi:hypothetical protein Tco_1112846 [Tanacetum coccineum]|uniref:Uncharacterized protein n=1 Tax=Tanacetum coccineum TaxID=301880 RepID=A0ABQ5ITI1_9ASTR